MGFGESFLLQLAKLPIKTFITPPKLLVNKA
jgi:hypothetical protein